jgi:signal peptidase I
MNDTPLRRRLRLDEQPPEDTVAQLGYTSTGDDAPAQSNLPALRAVAREMLETAIFVLLIFLIVRGVVQNFKIEGQSMEPNLHSGQYILVNKILYFHFDMNAPMRILPGNSDLAPVIVYPFRKPHRGDVVVFEYPRDFSKDYIKRVIGVEGDTVEIRDGHVFVNGQLLDESYLQGAQTVCRIEDRCAHEPIMVRAGSVFVLGDNRNNSSDSREWDELPLDRVIGKAWVSYWPQTYWGVIPTPLYAAP